MYQGWMSLGGAELWNAERTKAYVTANIPSIQLMGCEDCETLWAAVGDPEPYKNNPTDDNAPWIAPDEPDLALFYGFYPVSITGMTDNTSTVTVTEGTGDGGSVSAPRRTSMEFRVSGLLMAGSQIALSKGKSWLRQMVEGPDCGAGCSGADVCFFGACPSDYDQGTYYLRTIRDVSLLSGPTTTREFEPRGPGCEGGTGAYMEQVEFTFVSVTPFIYLPLEDLGSSMGSEGTTTGVLVLDSVAPALPNCQGLTAPPPINDPDVVPPPQPPRPPNVVTTLGPAQPWQSGYSLFIPGEHIPETLDAVLIISLTTGSTPARYVRIRLYAAPLGFDQKVSDLAPCSFCGEIVVTYIPPRSQFLADGMNQTLTITDTSGNVYPASHLAYTGGGLPVAWPALTCGLDYWMTVELPGPPTQNNMFITGAASDSSTFTTNLGSWTNGVNDGSPRATLTRDTGQFHTGPASMKVNWPLGSTDRPQVLINNLTVGATYELSAWIRSPSARIRLDLGPTSSGTQSNIGSSFARYVARVEATGTSMMARLSNTTTAASGDVWVDDLNLVDISSASSSVVRLDVSTARRE